jgi:Cof subfamily protein (haloacid dehalogenase superfamily)
MCLVRERSDGSVSGRTRAVLRCAASRGLTLLSVTARPPRRVRKIASEAGLHGIAVCGNGSVVYDVARDVVLREHRYPAEYASLLVESLRAAVPGVSFAVEIGEHYGCEPGYSIQREHPDDLGDPRLRRADGLDLCREGVTKLIVQHARLPLAELLEMTRVLASSLANVSHSGSNFVEVAAAGVSKASALEAYCAELGILAEEVIAFGDMPNDLPMLRWAGCGIAVANAHPEVLAADAVTRSNDADGVALVLERLGYGQTTPAL